MCTKAISSAYKMNVQLYVAQQSLSSVNVLIIMIIEQLHETIYRASATIPFAIIPENSHQCSQYGPIIPPEAGLRYKTGDKAKDNGDGGDGDEDGRDCDDPRALVGVDIEAGRQWSDQWHQAIGIGSHDVEAVERAGPGYAGRVRGPRGDIREKVMHTFHRIESA